jgi:hypothetical protein
MFFICIGSNLTLDCVASRQGPHNGHRKARHESIWSNTAINRALEIQHQRTIDHTFMAIELVYESSLRAGHGRRDALYRHPGWFKSF